MGFTAATYPNDAIATTDPIDRVEPGSIILFGDSYLAQNLSITGNNFTNTASEGSFNWANSLLGNRFKRISYKGIGGQTVQQLIDRFATDVKGAPFSWVNIETGANDLYSAPLRDANYMAQKLGRLVDLCVADGKKVLLDTEYPHTFSSNSQLAAHLGYNRWIKDTFVGSRNVVVADLSLLVDPTSTQYAPRAGFTWDGQHHPNNIGAYYAGKIKAAALNSLIPSSPYLTGYEDYTNATDLTTGLRSNLLDNPTFQGTGGTNTTGGTGTPPTGYAVTKIAGASCNVSMAAVVDPISGLTIGNYVQLDITFAANLDEIVFSSANIAARMGGTGTAYTAEISHQIVTPGPMNLLRFRVKNDSGSGEVAWGFNNDKANPGAYLEATTPMRSSTYYTPVVGNSVITGVFEYRIQANAAGNTTVRLWLPRVKQVL